MVFTKKTEIKEIVTKSVEKKPQVSKKSIKKRATKDDLIEQLIKNNISLQHKNVELIGSISKLNSKISEMVSIFDEAAKHIRAGTDEPLIQKLEKLLDQNKVIANGLVLLEKYIREKAAMSEQVVQQQFSPKPFKRPGL